MRLFSCPLVPPLRVYHMASDMPGKERPGEGPNHIARHLKGRGLNSLTRDALGEERFCGG